MSISISTEEARRALAAYHFRPTSIRGVLERLGTVQYDPLNPVGRNPDLVLQARVPGYRVDDWQRAAYVDRIMYDAWDKMACLVPIGDWPMRAYAREFYRPWHDNPSVDQHPDATAAALEELDRRGPLSSLEFEDKARIEHVGSWLGPSRIKRILRALWSRGVLATHHREGTRHYYDRSERIIPEEVFRSPVLVADAYHRWVVLRRHQAVGILRPTVEAAVWVACGTPEIRRRAIGELVEAGRLIPLHVGIKNELFHAVPQFVEVLNSTPNLNEQVLSLGPLDSLLWDRKALRSIFAFEYAWEVYKPLQQRVWGYYVLPVFFRDRFVGRVDWRLEGKILNVKNWWWETDVGVDAELLEAVTRATENFMTYVGATRLRLTRRLPADLRAALRSAV